MKILVLCRELPLPLTSGEKIRCYHILKGLARDHDVTLVSLVLHKSDLTYINELKKFCQSVYTFEINFSKKLSALKTAFSSLPWDVLAYQNNEAKLKISELNQSQKFDIIWINFLSMSGYVNRKDLNKTILILDQHNADELVWANYIRNSTNPVMKTFAWLNRGKVKSFQRKIFKDINVIVCVSKEDAEYIKPQIPAGVSTWIIPNGVDTEYFVPVNTNRKVNAVMLCASMDVTMNIDAALQFAKIFPNIKQKIPDAEFWIVGRNPPKQIVALNQEGYIKVTGSVIDVRPYYNEARVIVAPYRFGGGTKLKILEAIAMNLPIVSTTMGCQGIDTTGMSNIIIRDDINQFSEAVIDILLGNTDIIRQKVHDSSKILEERYSWTSITRKIDFKLTELFKMTLE